MRMRGTVGQLPVCVCGVCGTVCVCACMCMFVNDVCGVCLHKDVHVCMHVYMYV